MKKIVASLTLLSMLFQAAPAMAWVGGPYSNNAADGRFGGVFQGMITMKNGSGMFRFSSGSEPFISPNANSVVFHQGLVYYGDCFGMVDFPSKKISGITNGRTTITAPAASAQLTPVGTPSIQFGNGADDFIANIEWSGKLTKTAPGVLFKAKGWAYFFEANYVNQISTDIITVGIQDEIPGEPTATVDTSITQTITENEPTPKQKVRVKVFGSRVSPIAYTTFTVAAPTP